MTYVAAKGSTNVLVFTTNDILFFSCASLVSIQNSNIIVKGIPRALHILLLYAWIWKVFRLYRCHLHNRGESFFPPPISLADSISSHGRTTSPNFYTPSYTFSLAFLDL